MNIRTIVGASISIIIAEACGIIGSIFTAPAIPLWYVGIAKPFLTPPAWVFAPVWTTLFALMGIAAFLVWRRGLHHKGVVTALSVYGLQLALNMLWSFIFFGTQDPRGAFIDIVALWIAILATIILFGRVSRVAAWLLVPYLLWVSFASYLNYSIWMLLK